MSDHPYGIERIETYLPPASLTSQELANRFGFDLEFIENKIGVKQLFVADGEKVSDFAVHVMEQLFDACPFLRSQLDVLVVCTQTPDYQLPQVSAIVQNRCKLSPNVAAFDINLGCSGFVYGVNIVKSFLSENSLESGVLITAETYSSVIDPSDRNTKCLFSDGAAATLITRTGNVLFGKFRFGTDGEHYDSLIVRPSSSEAMKPRLFMDGRGIFGFAVSTIPSEVRYICEANNVSLNDIDFFVFHQASKFLLDAITKKIESIDSDRVVNVLHLYGNTVSSSIPMALKETLALHGRHGLKILISGFGVGLSWGTTILSTEGDCSDV